MLKTITQIFRFRQLRSVCTEFKPSQSLGYHSKQRGFRPAHSVKRRNIDQITTPLKKRGFCP